MPGKFHDYDHYLALPRAPEKWIVEDLLPTSGRLAMFAPPKTGKSWAALQMVADIAGAHDEWLGFPIRTHGKVLYLQLDTPRGEWIDYLQRLKALGYPMNNIYFADREELPEYPFDIRSPMSIQWVKEAVSTLEPVAVVFDTWRESFRGEENNSDTAQSALSHMTEAAKPAAVIIVSHVSKAPQAADAPKRSLVDSIRGSTYLAGAVDGLVQVEKYNMNYQSRTVPERRLNLGRGDEGEWVMPETNWGPPIRRVLKDEKLTSFKARARKLAEMTGRTEQQAKAALLAHVEGHDESFAFVPSKAGLLVPSGTIQ